MARSYGQNRGRGARRASSSRASKITIDESLHARCVVDCQALGLNIETFVEQALLAELARPRCRQPGGYGEETLRLVASGMKRDIAISEIVRAKCVLAAEDADVPLHRLLTEAVKARLAKAKLEIKEQQFLTARAEAEANNGITPQRHEFGLA